MLRASTLYQVSRGREFALEELGMMALNPALCMQIGWESSTATFFIFGLIRILKGRYELVASDWLEIDPVVLFHIDHINEALNSRRLELANRPPTFFPDPDCENVAKCMSAWDEIWRRFSIHRLATSAFMEAHDVMIEIDAIKEEVEADSEWDPVACRSICEDCYETSFYKPDEGPEFDSDLTVLMEEIEKVLNTKEWYDVE